MLFKLPSRTSYKPTKTSQASSPKTLSSNQIQLLYNIWHWIEIRKRNGFLPVVCFLSPQWYSVWLNLPSVFYWMTCVAGWPSCLSAVISFLLQVRNKQNPSWRVSFKLCICLFLSTPTEEVHGHFETIL